ncbi:MAG TPA: hypothetical protein VLX85_15345 [Stellaceae bacterium]|nr:hypothetical protein [Stellaceae bacterium]
MYAHASLPVHAPVIRRADRTRRTPCQFHALIAATLLVGLFAIANPVASETAPVGSTVMLIGP